MPLLECVRHAESERARERRRRAATCRSTASRPTTGRCRSWCSAEASQGRTIVTVQALGGTGGLKVGADFLRSINPRRAGLDQRPELGEPPRAVRARRVQGQRLPLLRPDDPRPRLRRHAAARSNALPAGAIVVLHACCHNPTGVDLTHEQWTRGARGRAARAAWCRSSTSPTRASPTALDADALRRAPVRRGDDARCSSSSSFSKSFSLYGERVGALSVVTGERRRGGARAVQLKRVVRTNYSNPPTHGGQIVATVLDDARAAQPVGAGARRRCATASRRCASALVDSIHARVPGCRLQLRAAAARHVLLLRPDARSRCSGCARSTRSTPSTPAASASPRSTRRTSTTSPTRSPRSSGKWGQSNITGR